MDGTERKPGIKRVLEYESLLLYILSLLSLAEFSRIMRETDVVRYNQIRHNASSL